MIRRIINKLANIWRHSIFGRIRKNPNAIRWGVIGLGYMAETFSNAIDGNKDGYVAAVASRSLEKAEKFAKRHGNCKAYGSYEEMLHDPSLELDVVYVATPVKCHFEHIKLCLENGKNVLCEKPITFTAKELEELMSLAQEKRCFLMEGMWMKCLPPFRKAQQWIEDNWIGKIELIKTDFYKHEIVRPGYAIYDADKGGGVIHDFGVYALAFITNFLGGMPEDIIAKSRYSADGLDTDWQILASRNGIKAVVNLSSDFGSISKAAVVGANGSIEWESQFNRTNCIKLFDKSGNLVEVFKVHYHFEGFEFEVDEVQSCIRENLIESKVVPLSQSLNVLNVLEKIIAVQ